MRRALIGAIAVPLGAMALLAPRAAEAHAIPRLYTAFTPSVTYDPINGCMLGGVGFLLGLGVDPERDALLLRADLFGALTSMHGRGIGFGSAILYRWVFRSNRDIAWTWALGGGGLVAIDDPDAMWAVVGVRGELGVRLAGVAAFSVFALAGPAAGRDVRVPWATPIGLSVDLGLP